MMAIQIVAPERIELVDLPVPETREGEVLVEVRTVSTCPHWDTSLYRGMDILERPGYPRYPLPVGYPGHEMAGAVAEVGPGARSFKVGDRVAATVSGGETNPGFYCPGPHPGSGGDLRGPARGREPQYPPLVTAHLHCP